MPVCTTVNTSVTQLISVDVFSRINGVLDTKYIHVKSPFYPLPPESSAQAEKCNDSCTLLQPSIST